MQEKLNQLSLGEKLLLAGAAIILIASFFNWAEATVSVAGFGGASEGGSGWASPGSIWSVLAILIAVAAAGALAAMKFGNVTLPALPNGISWGMVFGAAAVLVIVFMLLKAWRISALPGCGDVGDLDGFECSVGFAIGYWIALIGAIIFAAGGYMLYSADKGVGFGGLRSNT